MDSTISENKLTSRSKSSDDDLEICFKLKGEEFSLFIGAEKLSSTSRSDFIAAMQSSLACVACCSGKQGFVACMARCEDGGKCCDNGQTNCEDA